MKYLLNFIFGFLLITLSTSCFDTKTKSSQHFLSSKDRVAESVYLTNDNFQKPVICWTERDTTENRHYFYFSISEDNGKTFISNVNVPIPMEVSTHAEGMPKVAFKKDGTIIAAYEHSTPTATNKWAGAIYFVLSHDRGKSWSSPNYLHSDTVSGRSRGFFDLAKLPDGEVGAAWLDIKAGETEKGRTIRFAKTNGDYFMNEITLESHACECCRIDLHADASSINIAYRSVRQGNFNQVIRDMMIVKSTDNGKTFTEPSPISSDKWILDKCPHSGPSLATDKNGLHCVWYTEGNGKGVYISSADGEAFVPRSLVSNEARFPQVAAGQNSLFIVWSQEHENGNRIQFEKRKADGTEMGDAGPDGPDGFYPVVLNTSGDEYLIAYLAVNENLPKVFFTLK